MRVACAGKTKEIKKQVTLRVNPSILSVNPTLALCTHDSTPGSPSLSCRSSQSSLSTRSTLQQAVKAPRYDLFLQSLFFFFLLFLSHAASTLALFLRCSVLRAASHLHKRSRMVDPGFGQTDAMTALRSLESECVLTDGHPRCISVVKKHSSYRQVLINLTQTTVSKCERSEHSSLIFISKEN